MICANHTGCMLALTLSKISSLVRAGDLGALQSPNIDILTATYRGGRNIGLIHRSHRLGCHAIFYTRAAVVYGVGVHFRGELIRLRAWYLQGTIL